MNKALMAELEKLDADERIRLAYDLLESVAAATSATPITEAQRREIRRRLAEYRANPLNRSSHSFAVGRRLALHLSRNSSWCVAYCRRCNMPPRSVVKSALSHR
jgi:putative addiction module component (TIGR02574 family)